MRWRYLIRAMSRPISDILHLMTQSCALDILKTGKNAFVTGPAGSGKTYVVNEYIRYLKEQRISVGVTASTGIAATHMGGVTIHSWAGIGIKDTLDSSDLHDISSRSKAVRAIEAAHVLIIDEVSMLHHFRLDMVDRVLRHIKKVDAPFGGIQVVLCGDFFQLPPISRLGEPEARFIFEAESWKAGNFSVCYLEESHRQGTDPIVDILNEIRSGHVSPRASELLQSRMLRAGQLPASASGSDAPVRLYTHNIDVDAINDREISSLDGVESVHEMSTSGRKPLVDALKKSCLAPERLRLKKGARVMCVKNNFDEGYVNGTLGTVVSCGWGIDPVIHTAPTPDYPHGRKITIEQAEWTIEDEGKVLAQITQYPLRLAWAITVHKSQGMSLDAVEVDLAKSFEPGMGYVALSRVRSLAGLSIIGINDRALDVHPHVLEYDAELRDLSRRAESIIDYTDRSELDRVHGGFLEKAGGRARRTARKVSTFQETARLVRDRMGLAEMAAERDISVDTIIRHLERLVDGSGDDHLGLEDIQYLKDEVHRPHWAKIEKALEDVSSADERARRAAIRAGESALYRPPLLSAVKSRIKGASSFRDIQLARVILGYMTGADRAVR